MQLAHASGSLPPGSLLPVRARDAARTHVLGTSERSLPKTVVLRGRVFCYRVGGSTAPTRLPCGSQGVP